MLNTILKLYKKIEINLKIYIYYLINLKIKEKSNFSFYLQNFKKKKSKK